MRYLNDSVLSGVINIVRSTAGSVGIDPNLAQAIAEQETGCDGTKARYESHYKYLVTPEKFASLLGISQDTETVFQKCSWGPMQVMGANCRSMGYAAQLPLLVQNSLGALYGCRMVHTLQKKYPDTKDLLAAYNAGSADKINGQYRNQDYVDSVIQKLIRIQKLK